MVATNNERLKPGFILQKTAPSQWQVSSEKYGVLKGDLVKVWQTMVWDYEFANKEVRMALDEMEKNNHNTSHFGIFKTFIFTEQK